MTLELFVKDLKTGTIHQVGDDVHDSLYVDENGYVQYYNMQNGCGTMVGWEDADEADDAMYEFLPYDPFSPNTLEEDEILRQAEKFRMSKEKARKNKDMLKASLLTAFSEAFKDGDVIE